jgi:hypothetical protein
MEQRNPRHDVENASISSYGDEAYDIIHKFLKKNGIKLPSILSKNIKNSDYRKEWLNKECPFVDISQNVTNPPDTTYPQTTYPQTTYPQTTIYSPDYKPIKYEDIMGTNIYQNRFIKISILYYTNICILFYFFFRKCF